MPRIITQLDTTFSPVISTGFQFDVAINALARTTLAGAAGRIDVAPLIVPTDITISAMNIEVTTGVASAQGKIVLYDSTSAGVPNALITASGDLDFATSSTTRTYTYAYTFKAGVVYWLGIHHSSTATLRSVNVGALRQLGVVSGGSANNNTIYRLTSTYASGAPASLSGAALTSAVAPSVKIVVA